MAIRRTSLDSYSGLRGLTVRDDSVLAEKISRLIIWYSLQKRDLSDEDKSLLDSSLVECYRRYGIDFDNATITDETGAFKTMPVFADWYEVLSENPDTRHLAVVLSRYVTGSAAAWGRATTLTSITSTSFWTPPVCRTTSSCPASSGRRISQMT